MDLKQLQVFAEVATAGSLSKAAVSLSVSQPLITRHVRALEDELGIELFFRNGRGVSLTEAGRLLKQHADDILNALSRARSEMGAFQANPTGKLVVGVPPSVGTVLTVPLVKKIKNEYPHIALRVIEGFSGHVFEWLLNGRIDAAVLYGSPNHPSVLTEPLVEDELFLLGPAPYPVEMPRGRLPLEWFARLPMILPSRPHGLRRLLDTVLADHAVEPRIELELEAMPSALLLVEEGAGFTVLPYASVHHLVEQGRISCWSFDPPVTRTLLLATSNQRPMSTTMRAMLRTVRKEVRDIISTQPWRPPEESVQPTAAPS